MLWISNFEFVLIKYILCCCFFFCCKKQCMLSVWFYSQLKQIGGQQDMVLKCLWGLICIRQVKAKLFLCLRCLIDLEVWIFLCLKSIDSCMSFSFFSVCILLFNLFIFDLLYFISLFLLMNLENYILIFVIDNNRYILSSYYGSIFSRRLLSLFFIFFLFFFYLIIILFYYLIYINKLFHHHHRFINCQNHTLTIHGLFIYFSKKKCRFYLL